MIAIAQQLQALVLGLSNAHVLIKAVYSSALDPNAWLAGVVYYNYLSARRVLLYLCSRAGGQLVSIMGCNTNTN